MPATARKLDVHYEYRRPRPKRRAAKPPSFKKTKRRVQKKRQRAPRKSINLKHVQIVGTLAIIFLMAFALVVTQALIAERGYQLTDRRQALATAQARTEQLESQIASLTDPERVLARAEAMGMVPVSGEGLEATSTEIPESTPGLIATHQGSVSEPSRSSTEHRVVVELESGDEETVQMADLRGWGDWLLQWLRGGEPVEAHDPGVRR